MAGQRRFNFFKTDFYKGCAAVGLIFDLARPDTFQNVIKYCKDIRKQSGNIPIILVGNKEDLEEDVGESVSREKIVELVNQYNLLEYIPTSALQNKNVNLLFNRLALASLLDLQPRRGVLVDNRFNFKILLVGDAAVGKSSLIRTFVEKKFQEDYKLTVGIDFMSQDFSIPDHELTNETRERMKRAVEIYHAKYKATKPTDLEASKATEKTAAISDPETIEIEEVSTVNPEEEPVLPSKSILTRRYLPMVLFILAAIVIITVLIHFLG